jgi:hypothetical protein
MNWDALGAIGEIIGAIAVFVTLLYLASQIRQNTKAARSNAVNSSVSSVVDMKKVFVENDEIADLYVRGSSNPDELDEKEWLKYRILLSNIMWASWNVYSQKNLAELNSSVWDSQIPAIHRALMTNGGKRYWAEFGNEFDDEFRSEVARILSISPKT